MVVNYDGEDFPGEITCCDGNDQFDVGVMHKSGLKQSTRFSMQEMT